MEGITILLTAQLDRPVFDNTGLAGKYDFKLEFASERQTATAPLPGNAVTAGAGISASTQSVGETVPVASQEFAPSLAVALQTQLGLRLERKNVPFEMIIIDRIERTPTEN